MRTLNRLLLSEIYHIRGQAIAICLVLACGVAIYVMATSTIASVEKSYHRYYRDYRFADLFLNVKRAPKTFADRLRDVPGVADVDVRIVRDVVLDVAGMSEPATGRLVSIPDNREPRLNAIHLRRGRFPSSDRRGEVLVSEQFADAHGLHPGDEMNVIMGGRKDVFAITGVGLSPEYIYAVQPGQFLPDDRHFGVFWMPERQMAAAFNMEGAFNDAVIRLVPRSNEQAVIDEIDRIAERYGSLGAFARDEQVSHRRVADEIEQLHGMASVSPAIFMAVAAFLFNLVFSRVIKQQREEIASLRAFGYYPAEIGLHYAKMLLFLVACGVFLGTCAGIVLARQVVVMFAEFFRFPAVYHQVDWRHVPVAGGFALVVSLLGGASSIRRAMELPPAVAMRPEAPDRYRQSLVERIGLKRIVTPVGAMILRRLERNWRATGLSILGLSLGVSILVLGSFFEDTVNYVIDVQFERSQRQDVTVTFNDVVSPDVVHNAEHLPGVEYVEPFRAVPVRLKHDSHSRRSSLLGLESPPTLFRILDSNRRAVPILPGGITVSQKQAELLDVQVGDEVEVEFLEGRQFSATVPVVGVFSDYTDPSAYLRRDDLHRLMQESERVSGVFLAVNDEKIDELHRELKQTPVAAGVSLKQSLLDSFNETIVENLQPMRVSYAIFASIIACGVIYSCMMAAFAERARSLATLRVLGFSRFEVAVVLLGELAVIVVAALPVGLPFGLLLSHFATIALDTETHRFPLVISNATFAYAATVILAAASTFSLLVARMVSRLDLISVLKVRD